MLLIDKLTEYKDRFMAVVWPPDVREMAEAPLVAAPPPLPIPIMPHDILREPIYAYVLTKWVVKVDENGQEYQTPDLPEGFTTCEDQCGQYVNLAKDSPNPNLVVVKVTEAREKHRGYIKNLKRRNDCVVLEEWSEREDGAVSPVVRIAPKGKTRELLIKQGLSDVYATNLVDTVPDVSLAKKMIRHANTFGTVV